MKRIGLLSCVVLSFALVVSACGAGNSGARPYPASGGSAGQEATGGTGGGGGAPPVVMGEHGLPVPAKGGVAKPAGTAGNLRVLDWAGFKAAVSWTFDDGQPSQIAHYAELQATGVPMTFYLNSASGGGSGFDAAWTQAVKDGHELGNHTVHHCHADLSGCTASGTVKSADDEIDACTAYITGHYPQAGVWTIAAPFGDTGWDKLAAARFMVNRGVGSGSIGANDSTDPFNLPCYMAAEKDTASKLNAQTDSARKNGKWQIFLIHTITPTTDNWYAPVGIGEITAGMSYGRSFGDVWMGTLADVAAYWLGQKLLKAAMPESVDGKTTWSWQLPVGFPPGKYLRVTVDGGSLAQAGEALPWDEHGYYEVALDGGSLTLTP